ncbi:MAG TPA: DUF4129 domain-containing protein [Gaiellaceae bacterium]|nr:DUF4129 domain-containing protein [Gaiellaceae bacterium]
MPATRHGALLALGLCLVVALAAAGGSWAPVGAAMGGSRFAVLAVLAAIAVVWLVLAARLGALGVVRQFAGVSLLTVAALVLALFVVGIVWQHWLAWSPWSGGAGGVHFVKHVHSSNAKPVPPETGVQFPRGKGAGGHVMLVEEWLAALGALLLGGVVAYRWLGRRRLALTAQPVVTPFVAFVDESVDDLRREKDVRRAIEACYARMERTLVRVGLARQSAEAPLEFLERAGVELGLARSSLERLTMLFEEAKFSRHALGEPTREEAIDALLALRAEATA